MPQPIILVENLLGIKELILFQPNVCAFFRQFHYALECGDKKIDIRFHIDSNDF